MAASESSQSAMAGTTCIELALEGERLCKAGDPKNGVRFFEEARKVGTADTHTLSAIYSQLGNAYFALGDYQKALECHKMDVEITQKVNDEVAEAKACGNLGNVYKMFAKFDEAAVYCRRYLNICQKLNDREGEARALYNLANVYHTQGKRLISSCDQELGELSRDIKSSLERAVEYYEKTLKVVTELSDYTTMGKSYGNLGNTHYLLGNFSLAVSYHQKRLELAQSIQDKLGERRALLNLGNANVFMGDFQGAIESYSATLKMAQEFGDKNTEAHACYSLANSYTFLRDYKSAVKYHLKYLDLIKDMDDKLGEGRAYWSLVNLHLMLHNPDKALIFAKKHHEVAELLNDKAGLASAKLNIQELEDILAQKKNVPNTTRSTSIFRENDEENYEADDDNDQVETHRFSPSDTTHGSRISNNKISKNSTHLPQKHNHLLKQHSTQHQSSSGQSNSTCPSCDQHSSKPFSTDSLNAFRLTLDKRQEQEQRRFKKQLNINLTGDVDGLNARRRARQQQETHPTHHHHHHREHPRGGAVRSSSSERLFDMIAHFQSGRIDDQRCEILKKPNHLNSNGSVGSRGIQGLLSSTKKKTTGSSSSHNDKENNFATSADDLNIANNISIKSSQQTTNPLTAAASVIKATYRKASLVAYPSSSTTPNSSNINEYSQHRSSISNPQNQRRPTVSTEHREQLFDLIAGAQRQRMDEQRASLPTITLYNGPMNRTIGNMLPTPNRNPNSSRKPPSSYGRPQDQNSLASSAQYIKPDSSAATTTSKSPHSPNSIVKQVHGREKSNSIMGPAQNHDQPTTSASIGAKSSAVISKQPKISKHFQTFDASADDTKCVSAGGDVRDEAKFLDNLMKYQSTRFNDQRSEFPRVNTALDSSKTSSTDKEDNSQADNFFNLIVRFQSDRIEDQRSAPP